MEEWKNSAKLTRTKSVVVLKYKSYEGFDLSAQHRSGLTTHTADAALEKLGAVKHEVSKVEIAFTRKTGFRQVTLHVGEYFVRCTVKGTKGAFCTKSVQAVLGFLPTRVWVRITPWTEGEE